MGRLLGGGQIGRELPRPNWTVALLWILAMLLWLCTAFSIITLALLVPADAPATFWVYIGMGVLVCLMLGAMAVGMALVIKYAFSAAVSAKLMERALRESAQKVEVAQPVSEIGGASHEEVVSLLSEIMENTLLDNEDKAAKYREAHERLEEFRVRYAESGQVHEMEVQLSEALRQHERTEITHIAEQVQRYMGLGLWERAMEMARALAEQFPENPEASRLPETVRLEQDANRRQEQQRLYREIEHLVSRKHWRQALRTAETLLEAHADSPEAHTLKDQMDELRRNAAISERREWEVRIAEHVQTGRHREAYALAMDLMEKYPDSPQALDIRQNLEQMKARAGITR